MTSHDPELREIEMCMKALEEIYGRLWRLHKKGDFEPIHRARRYLYDRKKGIIDWLAKPPEMKP